MHRRALLSTVAAVASAGCLGPAFSFGSDCPRGAELRLRPVTDADVAAAESDSPDELAPPWRDAVAAARRGDDATVWLPASASDPFSDTDYVAFDGTYGTVSTSRASSTDRTGYEISLEADESTGESAGRTVAFDDLPTVDRTALYVALGYNTFRKLETSDGARSISIGGLLAYPDDAAEADSALVPDSAFDAVRIGEYVFRYRITDTTPTTVETLRIDVRTVAESASAFADVVYERYGVDLDDRTLSTEQRDVVETAIAEGYDECAPYSDAYADLQTTLGGTEVGADGRVDYANYEDRWYAVRLSEYVA